MTPGQRNEIERELLRERERLAETLRRLAPAGTDAAHDRGRPGDDFSSGGAGGAATDDVALATRTVRALEEADAALTFIRGDPEHFGVCATCGASIPMERLRLVPGTRHCHRHAPL